MHITSLCGTHVAVQKVSALGFGRQFHSQPRTITQPDMRVRIIPALQDNYMYLVSVSVYLVPGQ